MMALTSTQPESTQNLKRFRIFSGLLGCLFTRERKNVKFDITKDCFEEICECLNTHRAGISRL